MSEISAILPVSNETAVAVAGSRETSAPPSNSHFGQMLADGLAQVEQRVDRAEELVRSFTLDGAVPVHQVSVALEEARLAVELALQVRNRLVEGYREIMNMQL